MVSKLTPLQQELVHALLDSGLSKETLTDALTEIELYETSNEENRQAITMIQSGEMASLALSNGHGESKILSDDSSDDGDDFTPPILKELENLSPEEAAHQRAVVERLLQ